MKQSPDQSDLMKNFSPSKFSAGGFLGNDTRTIGEIISADLKVLEKNDIEKEALAGTLQSWYDRAKAAMGGETDIAPGVTAMYHEARGKIPSPFRGEGTFEKGDVVLREASSGKEVVLTCLSIHLIRAHGFFQGKGQRFRVDPADIIDIIKRTGTQ
ncbi:MAG TPA: hypothetical protein PLT75_15905 [Spirochaetota bacterium]|nr:hypothetical protein [Spirochaetota bacterium]